ncbi:hypothetical protein PRIPAC_87094 [Pristionchus pacificus]|uniref:Uncharacterized protein n=1 Tax=Pristionchus pacificus TaxID=54126 RepID=A0A2A6CWG0_PRIPA|nr:hypothetical protein PRIPAC_87094 [Pristionchus pacificus]|eukprot:PDM82499.1 hypothetical protein PRIPAC_36892 [Pristionchus pacificus]
MSTTDEIEINLIAPVDEIECRNLISLERGSSYGWERTSILNVLRSTIARSLRNRVILRDNEITSVDDKVTSKQANRSKQVKGRDRLTLSIRPLSRFSD